MLAKVLLIASIVTLAVAQFGYEYEKAEEYGGPFEHKFEPKYEPKPYSFGYKTKDKHGEQHRHETGDGTGKVEGSYGFVDERGIHRIVHYIADHLGFRAKIVTNEPGTASQNPANVIMDSTY